MLPLSVAAIRLDGERQHGAALDAIAAELTDLKPSLRGKEIEIEMSNYIRRLAEMRQGIEAVLSPGQDQLVHWIESSGDKKTVELHRKPLDVAPLLRDALFETIPTVIMTSATLAVRKTGGLDWFCQSLGVPEAQELQVGSPFNYHENVVLRVPSYLNDPQSNDDYEDRAANAVQKYIERSQGGTFVLCTSYEFLRRLARRLTDRLRLLGFPMFVQGEGLLRSHMIEEFKKSDHSVLLGTDSFWQGVDVPGHHCCPRYPLLNSSLGQTIHRVDTTRPTPRRLIMMDQLRGCAGRRVRVLELNQLSREFWATANLIEMGPPFATVVFLDVETQHESSERGQLDR